MTLKHIIYYVDKYRIEIGAINGILFALGIKELVNHSIIFSLIAMIIGILLFLATFKILSFKNKINCNSE